MPENSPATAELHALAQWLETNRHAVVTDWINAVRDDAQIPDADRLTLAALQDHFPEMLLELIGALRNPLASQSSETRETAQDHGKARWRNGYQLDEVLRELARIREIILVRVRTFCRERNCGHLRDEADEKVRRFFDSVVATSARQYIFEQEAEVSLRTRQLHHAYEQVQAATEQLRDVAQSRLRLLRGVSHELRNAMQAVNFGAAALLEQSDAESRNSMLSQLGGSAAHLRRVLERLQEFSNILAGEVRSQPARLDVEQFLRSLDKPHRAAAEGKGLTFRCVAGPGLPAITMDSDKLRHIADILISNAVDYTERGSIYVMVRTDGADRWVLAVEDTGIGIDKADAQCVFREFHHSARTPKRGVGLGIVIARHLARLMDAEITFRSQLEYGTRFEVNLPVDLAAITSPPATPSAGV
jgi:signal transduction histidine kinase